MRKPTCTCIVQVLVAVGFVVAMIIVLSGCGTMNTYRTHAKAAGAQAYDEGLDMAVAVICNDTSVGSIKRRFGISKSSMQSWIQFCYGDQATIEVPSDAFESEPFYGGE